VKEHAYLCGRSGRGHLVLVYAECRRPCPLLKVNKLHRQWASGNTDGRGWVRFFSDALEQIRFDYEHGL